MKGTVKEKGELLDILFILFKDLSKKKIKNYLKDGGVLVNGKVVTKYDAPVKKNDVIELSKTNKTHKKSKKMMLLNLVRLIKLIRKVILILFMKMNISL